MFIFTDINESMLKLEGGGGVGSSLMRARKEAEQQGSLLAEITLSVIAAAERSCQRITGTAWGCLLSAGSDEQKVPLTCSYLTELLSASRALCLLDCQTRKKGFSQAGCSGIT